MAEEVNYLIDLNNKFCYIHAFKMRGLASLGFIE